MLYHSTLVSRGIKKKKKTPRLWTCRTCRIDSSSPYRGTSLIINSAPLHPTVGLCLGPYGGPRGGAVSYERGTPVPGHLAVPWKESAESSRGWCVGSYLRLIDSCITQLKAQGPSRTCNESKEEEDVYRYDTSGVELFFLFPSLLVSSLALSDTTIYEP